jgi:hypothetical protein
MGQGLAQFKVNISKFKPLPPWRKYLRAPGWAMRDCYGAFGLLFI